MLRLSYFLGNYFPRHGSQAFADALAARVSAFGGDIIMGTPVTRILVEGGRARGVELLASPARHRRRIRVRAPIVVCNSDLRRTIDQMLPPDAVDGELRARIHRMRPSFPCFLMHIGVRDIPSELLRERQGYYWDGWDSDRVGTDALRFKLFVPTLYEPSLAPPGGHVLIVQKVQELDYGAITDWAAHKRQVEEFILGKLDALIPGIAGHTVVRLSATAATHQRYTLNHDGAMLGWEMSPDQLLESRLDVSGTVPGLYFVGHWSRPGGGITPVIVSAMEAAGRIAADRPRDPEATMVTDMDTAARTLEAAGL